jgi:hypothetical protein
VSFLANEVGTKRLDLLRQLVPNAATVAMLVYPALPTRTPNAETCRSEAKGSIHRGTERIKSADVLSVFGVGDDPAKRQAVGKRRT